MLHLYSIFFKTPNALYWTNGEPIQPAPLCNTHSVPVRSPNSSYGGEGAGESLPVRYSGWLGGRWGTTPTLSENIPGSSMISASQDLSITSHPMDSTESPLQYWSTTRMGLICHQHQHQSHQRPGQAQTCLASDGLPSPSCRWYSSSNNPILKKMNNIAFT